MAYFSADDLIDAVRYEFGIEDDTGVCMKVVPRPARKSKPGGLPLDFRNGSISTSDDEQYSPNYLARVEDVSTKAIVETRLRSKTSESERSSAVDSTKCANVLVAGTVTSEGKKEEPGFLQMRPVPLSVDCEESLTTKLIREHVDDIIDPTLAAYAKHESTDPSQCRRLLVFFPFASPLPEERYGCAITINVYPRTSVFDLIGLCCYVYMRNQRKPEISDPSRFQMLMAEDNGEVDRDLPAIDGHRLLSELGSCWSTVAIVPRSSVDDNGFERTRVVVYTVIGAEYEFYLDSLDISLRWLRDQALERRKQREGDSFISEYAALQEYVLEALPRPDVPLNLEATIGSTSFTEFLMLRKNSSRGGFQLPVDTEEPYSPMLTPLIGDRHSPRFDFLGAMSVEAGSSLSLNVDKVNVGPVIEEFVVDRLHRYKPKSAARLSLCKDGFELKPDVTDRRRSVIFSVAFEKPIAVLWNCVAAVEVLEHGGAKRTVKIVFIPPSQSPRRGTKNGLSVFPSSSVSSKTDSVDSMGEDDDISKLYFVQISEKSKWKTLQLDIAAEDAYNCVTKANEILDSRQPQARSVYQCSAGGKRKPSVALEAVASFSGRRSSAFKVQGRPPTLKRSPIPKVRGNRISRLAVSIQKIWSRDHAHE